MATQLGRPAIIDPREFTLREVQLVIGNIRERMRVLDATVLALQTTQTVGAQSSAAQLAALQKQITALEQALDALTAVVDGLETGGDTDPRTEQLAGELMALQLEVDDLSGNDAGRLPQVEAQLGQLQQQVDEIDTVGQTPAHAALLQRLQDQVDDLNRSVLV